MITHSIYSPLAFAALLAAASGSMMAQVHYQGGQPWSQRARSGPDAEVPGWYYNLGLTGIRAELVANEPKALLVKYVLPKSPARNAIKIDDLIMRFVEFLMAFPYLEWVTLLMMITGSGILPMILALTLTGWLSMARLTRGQILSLKNED